MFAGQGVAIRLISLLWIAPCSFHVSLARSTGSKSACERYPASRGILLFRPMGV